MLINPNCSGVLVRRSGTAALYTCAVLQPSVAHAHVCCKGRPLHRSAGSAAPPGIAAARGRVPCSSTELRDADNDVVAWAHRRCSQAGCTGLSEDKKELRPPCGASVTMAVHDQAQCCWWSAFFDADTHAWSLGETLQARSMPPRATFASGSAPPAPPRPARRCSCVLRTHHGPLDRLLSTRSAHHSNARPLLVPVCKLVSA